MRRIYWPLVNFQYHSLEVLLMLKVFSHTELQIETQMMYLLSLLAWFCLLSSPVLLYVLYSNSSTLLYAVSRISDSFAEDNNGTVNRKRRHPDASEQQAIASVIIYRSLASLLPEHYDPDKRSLRYTLGCTMHAEGYMYLAGEGADFNWHDLCSRTASLSLDRYPI